MPDEPFFGQQPLVDHRPGGPDRTLEEFGQLLDRREKVVAGRRMGPGIGLKLSTASGELVVQLGPQWYIEQQGDIPIKAGDAVEVKGVRASRDGKDFFIAGEVKKGGDVLKLRDENGVPLWAGWRKGNS